jgi:hypothetical protein
VRSAAEATNFGEFIDAVFGEGIAKHFITFGTLVTNAEPSGTFTGGGGFPKTLVALSIYATASTGTPSITVQYAHLNLIRVG